MDIAFVFMTNPGVTYCPPGDTGTLCPGSQNTGGQNWFDNFFLLEPFYLNGVSYYSYRYFIFAGILINSAVTIVFEKWLIVKLT